MTHRLSDFSNPYRAVRYIPLTGRFAVEGSVHKTDYASIAEAIAARENQAKDNEQ